PEIPTWATALAFFVLINLINLTHVKAFGEAEFWFAIVKVGAIVGMILLGLYLLVSGAGGEQASVSNLWTHGGFFPDRKSTRLNSSHVKISYAVFCLKKKKKTNA